MEQEKIRRILNVITVISIALCIVFVIYGIKAKLFYSHEALQAFLAKFGIWAPIIFIIFQVVQVVFPVLPGGIGLLGGVLIFGPVKGFIYNYIGICLGSIVAFMIAKQLGTPIIKTIFSPKMQDKYMKWADNKNFYRIFTIAIFMPIAPDDFLCYLAGTTNMSYRRFTTVILLGKPLAIALYSFGLNAVFQRLVAFLQ